MTVLYRADSRLAPEHRSFVSQKHLEPFVRQSSQGVATRLSDWLPSVVIPPRLPVAPLTLEELEPEYPDPAEHNQAAGTNPGRYVCACGNPTRNPDLCRRCKWDAKRAAQSKTRKGAP